MHRSHIRLLLLPGAAALALASTLGTAHATAATVSPGDPFSTCTAGAFNGQVNFADAEVEPRVATDPTDPSHAIAVFQQDRWQGGAAHGVLASVSTDGGTSWTEPAVASQPVFSQCNDPSSDFPRASDPWVSIGENPTSTGTVAYFTALGANGAETLSGVEVSTSTDGGNTWGPTHTLIEDTVTSGTFVFDDKESVTADPFRPGTAYVVWDRTNLPQSNSNVNSDHSFAFRGTPLLSMTTDGGLTWSTPRSIMPRNSNLFTEGNVIVVLPDSAHTLVDVTTLGQGSGVQPSDRNFEATLVSHDGGQTWSGPFTISKIFSVGVVDPNDGHPIRTGGGLPDATVDSAGNLWVSWQDARFSGGAFDQIVLSESTDGGMTWTAPVMVNQTPVSATLGDNQAFVPSVHAFNGKVAVTYYDFRSGGPMTKYFLAECSTSCSQTGASWTESQLGGPFDISLAANTFRGYFLGDYQGLVDNGSAFLAVFGAAVSSSNPSDIQANTAS